MPLLPKNSIGYSATIGDAPISGGRRATAQDFGAPGFGETGLIEAGHKVTATAKAELTDLEEREAREALVKSTEVRAEYARRLDEAALSGTDLGKLKEQMNADLAKIGEQFQTVKGASQLQLYTANSAIMYDQQANQIAVQRAWSEARTQGQKFVNNASALIQSNPGYLAVAEKDAADFVSTFPGIRPDQRAELTDRLKKDLNMAAAVSAARMNPQDAKRRLEAGEWDLTPEQRSTAIDKAGTEIRAARADEAYQRAEMERQRREQDDKGRDEHFKRLIDGGWSRRAVMDDPRLRPETREHLIRLAESRAKELAGEERKSDPAVKRDLWLRVNAPEGDPRRIYTGDAIFQAVEAGKLNVSDANQLNALVAAQKDENGRAFGSRLRERMIVLGRAMSDSPEYKNQPDLAAAIQMNLVSQVEKRANELRKEGKSPDALVDPESKDYFFKPGLIKATADAVRTEARNSALGTLPRVQSPTDIASLGLKEGDQFLAPDGQIARVTKSMLAGAKSSAPAAPTFPVTPSGETPAAIEERRKRENSRAYSDALRNR